MGGFRILGSKKDHRYKLCGIYTDLINPDWPDIIEKETGIFVTTSYVSSQAYEEIKVDGYPVIIVCANDIGLILENHGYRTVENVQQWLNKLFSYL